MKEKGNDIKIKEKEKRRVKALNSFYLVIGTRVKHIVTLKVFLL